MENIIGALIKFANRFKGYLGLAAFVLLIIISIIYYLFPPGSFSGVALALGKLTGEQLVFLLLAILVFIFLTLLLLIGASLMGLAPANGGHDVVTPTRVDPADEGHGMITPTHVDSSEGSWLENHRSGLFLLMTVLVLLGALLLSRIYFPKKKTINSVAIIPFMNMSGDASNDPFSDGIAESITNSLTRLQLPNLKVIPRDSALRFKGQMDSKEIGRMLEVEAVLMGKFTRRDNDLLISAWLVDVRDNSQLWGDEYPYKLSELLIMQRQISKEVAKQLGLVLNGETAEKLGKSDPNSSEALEFYMKGRSSAAKYTEADWREALNYFDLAIDKDPKFAAAYAAKTVCYFGLSDFAIPVREAMPAAEAAALKALELDPELAEAHAAMGMVKFNYDWDWQATDREFKAAIKLNGNSVATRQFYAQYLTAMGRHDESIEEVKHIQLIDRNSPNMSISMGRPLFYARRYGEAIEQFQKAIAANPDSWMAYYFLGLCYEQNKELPKAIAALEKAHNLDEGNDVAAALGRCYANVGDKKRAQELLDDLLKKRSDQQHFVSHYDMAMIYVGLNKNLALDALQKAYDNRSDQLVMLRVSPMLDSLRDDERFKALLRSMRL